MFTQEQIQKIELLNKELEQKRKLLENKLSQLPCYPEIGEIFMFDNPDTIALQWIILFSYKNQLFLIVPADTNSILGSNDIAISKRALSGALTLRCSQYAWITRADFDLNLRIGILEKWHLQRAINKINQIFENQIENLSKQKETDIEPEYENWINQINETRKTLKLFPDLTDFKIIDKETDTDNEDVLMLNVNFAWPFESEELDFLRLEVFWDDGTAQLVSDRFHLLAFQSHIFEFVEDDDEWICELSPEWVSKIAKFFNLAQVYKEWEISITNLQLLENQLQNEQTGQIEKTIIYVNAQQRKIIDYFTKVAKKASISLIEILEELLYPMANLAMRGDNSNNKMGLNVLNPLVSKIEQTENTDLRLFLVWRNFPEISPIVEIEINGNPINSNVEISWENDFSIIHISGLKQFEINEVAVLWDDGKLRFLFK